MMVFVLSCFRVGCLQRMEHACVLVVCVIIPGGRVHRATQLLHRQQDSTSSSMAHCCMSIGDPADSGSTAIDDRNEYPSETF